MTRSQEIPETVLFAVTLADTPTSFLRVAVAEIDGERRLALQKFRRAEGRSRHRPAIAFSIADEDLDDIVDALRAAKGFLSPRKAAA